jgi:hypothetical protein
MKIRVDLLTHFIDTESVSEKQNSRTVRVILLFQEVLRPGREKLTLVGIKTSRRSGLAPSNPQRPV